MNFNGKRKEILPIGLVVVGRFDRFFRELIRQENVRRFPISKQFGRVVNEGIAKQKILLIFNNKQKLILHFESLGESSLVTDEIFFSLINCCFTISISPG